MFKENQGWKCSFETRELITYFKQMTKGRSSMATSILIEEAVGKALGLEDGMWGLDQQCSICILGALLLIAACSLTLSSLPLQQPDQSCSLSTQHPVPTSTPASRVRACFWVTSLGNGSDLMGIHTSVQAQYEVYPQLWFCGSSWMCPQMSHKQPM